MNLGKKFCAIACFTIWKLAEISAWDATMAVAAEDPADRLSLSGEEMHTLHHMMKEEGDNSAPVATTNMGQNVLQTTD